MCWGALFRLALQFGCWALCTSLARGTVPLVSPTDAERCIGSGLYIAPLDPSDLPPRASTPPNGEADEVDLAARAAASTARWTKLRVLVQDAGAATDARIKELRAAGVGVQSCWDIARSEILPPWINKINAVGDEILAIECTSAEADVARRRAWVRCRAKGGFNQGRLSEDAPSAIDADLWLEERWTARDPCVAWLQPMFDAAPDCAEEWKHFRHEHGIATIALRAESARARFLACTRNARRANVFDDAVRRSTMLAAEARLTRWRAHNARYIAQVCLYTEQVGHRVDALAIQCAFLHAENPRLFGERSDHATALLAAAKLATNRHPDRADELSEALVFELREYLRVSAVAVDSMLKSTRRFQTWLAGSQVLDEPLLHAVASSQRLGETRERLMARQCQTALQWLVDDPECEVAVKLKSLEASAESESWDQWRLLLDFAEGCLRTPRVKPREALKD